MRFFLSPNQLPKNILEPNVVAGAVVSFCGRVRDVNDGKPVVSLRYEAYEDLALKEGERILGQALESFPIFDAKCIHRIGHLELCEDAILVEVSAVHRTEAFAACAWIVDEIKAKVPIWKKEFYACDEPAWIMPVS
jgi:molybdopterin synthase catalytic subunit